eukprot:TRINITY_DN4011_c1_g4_i1.p1 TRINITY_DN4011_c1_g4~~TRINITY_DN4011_c1_g4_i1.p1  ORF type:complete len:708 (-),score=134.94 TRINITY_DN4011_c1_g4_i1:302-2425(-)
MAALESQSRVVALIDMDCFYCACERVLQPDLCGRPLVVVQYNPFQGDGSAGDSGVRSLPPEPATGRVAARGSDDILIPTAVNGSIIAVSYEARERGVTRFMRGREALEQCNELIVVQVPTAHGKSDMGLYRRFGAKVRQIVAEVCGPGASMEKASVDEIYVDVTAPARALAAGDFAAVAMEAAEAGTHVAGKAEGASEAAMGQQTSGPLGRSAFRAGHSGQVLRAMSDASRAWWTRDAESWPAGEALLAAGAALVARARAEVTRQLGFTCSAGVAANKMLAKLCGGLHKPNQQTVLPAGAVAELLDPLPVDRLRGFGGKLGELLKRGRPELGIAGFESCGALRKAGEAVVAQVLRGEWAHPEEKATTACRMASGRDDAAVEQRPFSKSIGGGKNFSGSRGLSRGPLDTYAALEVWVRNFAEDVWARLEEEEEVNERSATQIVVHVSTEAWRAGRSKRCRLRPGVAAITADAMNLLRQLTSERPPHQLGIVGVGLAGDSFVSASGKAERGALQRMFQKAASSSASASEQVAADAEEPWKTSNQETVLPTEASLPASLPENQIPSEASGQASKRQRLDENVHSEPASIAAPKKPFFPAVTDSSSSAVVIDVSQESADLASSGDASFAPLAKWSCRACTLLNEPAALCCEVCGTSRKEPSLSKSSAQPAGESCRSRGGVAGKTGTVRGKSGPSKNAQGGIAALLLKSKTS